MANDIALQPDIIKDEKDLYKRYGLIINSEIDDQVIAKFKNDIILSKKVNDKEANALLGELYYSQGKYREAFDAYNQSKINSEDVNGDFFGGLWGKIKCVIKKGEIVTDRGFLDEEQAKFNYFDTLLRLKGNDLNVISMYERSLKKSPKMLKFEENYKLMYETNRKEFDACVKIKISAGLAYCNANDKKGYEKGFKIMHELFETIEDTRSFIDNDVANKMIFYLMDKKESFEKIINTYYRYLDLDSPNNISLNIHLGKYFFENGRYELAKEHLRRTDDKLSQIYLAKILYRENKNENMFKVYELIKDKFALFTKEEDYYMYADACLFIYYNDKNLETIDVIRSILALKEFIEGNKEGKKSPKVDAYYQGELSDLYFQSGDLLNAKNHAYKYYEKMKDNRKTVTEYESLDNLNSYHLHRGRGLYICKRNFEAYEHLSSLGNYSIVKDELLELVNIISDYTTTDYNDRIMVKFDNLVDIVKRLFPKKRRKRFPYLGSIYMKKCMLLVDFKRSFKLGKKYLRRSITNRAKLKNLIDFYKENKKEMKRRGL